MNERMTPTERACGCRVDLEAHGDVIGTVVMISIGVPPHITYCATHSAARDEGGAGGELYRLREAMAYQSRAGRVAHAAGP